MRIGVDLGGTKIAIVALGESGNVLFEDRTPTPRNSYEETLQAIASLVANTEQKLKARTSIGVGTPGAISPASGLLKNSNSTWLNGRPFQKDLERVLGNRPIRMSNDANCFALSEAVDGSAAGKPVVFGVILGTGVGGGVVSGGKVHLGLNAIGGEWGHNPLPIETKEELPGPRCYCGRRGCIETWLSGPSLEREYQSAHLEIAGSEVEASGEEATREDATGEEALREEASRDEPFAPRVRATEIAEAADRGEALADSVLRAYEDRLARALGTVINLLDPDAIVLGGGLSQIDRLYESVPKLWEQYVFSDRVDTPLLSPKFGDASGVRGAAWLWNG